MRVDSHECKWCVPYMWYVWSLYRKAGVGVNKGHKILIRIKVSPNQDSITGVVATMGFPIGVFWYPHWENRDPIRIKVSPNQDSIMGVVVTMGFPIGVFWYPHWENRDPIRIKVSPNQDSIVDNHPISVRQIQYGYFWVNKWYLLSFV